MCDGQEDCPLTESGHGGEDEENCPQEAEGKKYPLQCTVTLVFLSFKARQFLFCSLPTGSGGDWWSEEVTWCNLEEVKVSSYSLLVLTIGKKHMFQFGVFVFYFRSTSYF